MNIDLIRPPEAQALHINLGQGLKHLRFTEPLEVQFQEHLHYAQRRTVMFSLYVSALVWLFYTGLDVWRLRALAGSVHETEFIWGSFAWRWPVLLCFVVALCILHSQRSTPTQRNWMVMACLLGCSLAIPISSYTLKNLGMPETSVVMVLLVSMTLFPLGIRLRLVGPVALLISLYITAAGPLVLRVPEEMRPHWVLSAIVWITFILSGVAAYYREKSLREQFVLRRLLNWEASHDPLTGLANRRKFQEHLDTCLHQAQRQQAPLYLAILDIDHFKLYNDHYGHSAGDAALNQVAQLLQQHAQRPLDLAVRLGGEEFGLVVFGIPAHEMAAHLDGMQRELRTLHIAHAASPTASHLTVSIGAALIGPGDTPDTVFRRADSLLYQAKRQGRNQACLETQAGDASTVLCIPEQAAPGLLTGQAPAFKRTEMAE